MMSTGSKSRHVSVMFALIILSTNIICRSTAFSLHVVKPPVLQSPQSPSSHIRLAAPICEAKLGSNSNSNGEMSDYSYYEYKDDCFGFVTFLGGLASRDVAFTGLFIALSLVGAVGCRQRWLPVDPKRNTIVDRRVPGVVAMLTLLLSPVVAASLDATGLREDLAIPSPPQADDPIFGTMQILVCGFSIITAFLDIRWRDRFDYPGEFLD